MLISLTLAMVQGVLPLWGRNRKAGSVWVPMLSSLAVGQCGFLLLAFGCLVISHAVSDFSVLNVWENSHSLLPAMYKIAGTWGNHEGSMVLWATVLSVFSSFLVFFGDDSSSRLRADVLMVQAWISVAVLVFILQASNPFLRLDPVPGEGQGLNPVLQDWSLAIHPPLLYMGYVGFSLSFSFAIAALLSGRADRLWAIQVRPWVILSWVFLTAGIASGAWWAYYELGWGGWWFWDPVENVSLMPWLSATALLHSLAVMVKRDLLRLWTVFLSILTFALSLFGTFLVRSGILTSVHAFAVDPWRGVLILSFGGILTGGALFLLMVRGPGMQQRNVRFEPVSKEGIMVLNNLVLLSALGSVFVGTVYPIFFGYFSQEGIAVGPPYFNINFSFFTCLAFFLLPFGIMIPWRQRDVWGIAQRLRVIAVIVAGVVLGGVAWDQGRQAFWSWLGIGFALWTIMGVVVDMVWNRLILPVSWQEFRTCMGNLSCSAVGSRFAHAGAGVIALGVLSAANWQQGMVLVMRPGDHVDFAGYRIVLDAVVSNRGDNYSEQAGIFDVSGDGVLPKRLEAARRRYVGAHRTTSEVAIGRLMTSHLYIVFGGPGSDGGYVVDMRYYPWVILIWCGAGSLVFGGILSILEGRSWRRKRRSPGYRSSLS